jgi:ABC-type uncharacterized transport system permease subunit
VIESFLSLAFVISVFRMATPLIFAALGGLLSERSGVVNIALEGHMLLGAFVGASAALLGQSVWVGWFSAGLAGAVLAAIYAYFVVELNSEPVVAGTALNLLMIGGIPLASKSLFDSTGATPALSAEMRFAYEPIIGALLLALLIHFLLFQTSSGLWISFAGRRPEALAPQGLSLKRVRWICVMLCGVLAAWGGATLSLYLASAYSPLMSGGRGFMALAAMIFGRWAPIPTLAACFFFGLTEAVQIRLQGIRLGETQVPVQLIQVIPYVVTLVILFYPFRKKVQ